MKKARTSYITQSKTKNSLAWPIVTLMSFLIILVLLVLLIFSHLDSINNIINVAQIQNKINQLNDEYSSSLIQTNEVNQRLLLLKNELVALEETDGEKLNFYNSMKSISDVKNSFAQKIYSSFNTRNILNENKDNIFISEKGDVCVLMNYLFENDSYKVNKKTNDFYKVLAKKIYEVLTDSSISPYISFINIDIHTSYNDIDTVSLALKRGENIKTKLIESYQDLQMGYQNKIIVRSFEDSKHLKDSKNNDRIEITLTLNNDSILNGIRSFVETKNQEDLNKK